VRLDRRRLLLVLSYVGFISLGLPDGLLGVAWPSVRATFGLPLDALGALLLTSTSGYVLSSFLSGRILARVTVGTLLAASCLLTATALLGYAVAPAWWVMVVLGSLAGLGAGAIDAGINTYVATNHSARTLNFLHAFYGLGTTSGPLILTSILAAGLPWQRGYAIVGVAQLVLAGAFTATRSSWPRAESSPARAARSPSAIATLRLRGTQLGIVAFFAYVGIEAAAGAWTFTLLAEGRGVDMSAAGTIVSLFWGGLMAGRVLAAATRLGARPHALLRVCAVAVLGSAALLAANAGHRLDVVAAAMLGCACGPIFPSLIATTPARVGGDHAANAIGFQVAAAAVGQSLLPALIGTLADAHGLETIATSIVALSAALTTVCFALARAGSFMLDAPESTIAAARVAAEP
jgi:fucose permease